MSTKKYFLFSYGTLQLERVQVETYGRILKGEEDNLPNYILGKVKIRDRKVIEKSGKEFHPIAIKTGRPDDLIKGTIFEITKSELEKTDTYEVDDYKRVSEKFSSGRQAWVYVAR